MQNRPSFLDKGVRTFILSENADYSWLRSASPKSVESLHQLCDDVYRSLWGGPLFDYAKDDWDRAIEIEGFNQIYVQYAKRSERAGMLTVFTNEGFRRHCDVLLGLAHAVLHNRQKDSLVSRIFNSSAGMEKNCTRVGFAFLRLVDTRMQNSQSLPWDPNFPLETLKTL